MSMTERASQVFSAWCERHCGAPMAELQPVGVDGWQVVQALWPLNNDFRAYYVQFRALPYSAAHEPRADAAIEHYLTTGRWGPMELSTWRVLLERQTQALIVAARNAQMGNPPLFVPQSLPDTALQGAAMIWLLHSMRLPFPPQDHSGKELPVTSPVR